MDTTLTQAPASGAAWRCVLRPLITRGAALSRAFARWGAR